MPNIDLSNIYRKTSEKRSQVDSEIKLNNQEAPYEIYSDLKLDLEFESITERPLNAKENRKDLVKITNKESVINAVKNILSTTSNSRLLNPDITISLQNYLFDVLTVPKAYSIVYEIRSKLLMLEPRVTIRNVTVTLDFSSDAYIISLEIFIPDIQDYISLSAILSDSGVSIAA